MMKVRELGKFIRDQRRTASLSLRKLSSLAGVSNPYLSQIERGLRRPSAEILQAIAKALSISAETLYVKAGILDERGEAVDLPAQIRADETITERQRQILIDLYQSFRVPVAVARRVERAPRKSKTATSTPRAAKPKSAASAPRAAKPKPAAAAARPKNGKSSTTSAARKAAI